MNNISSLETNRGVAATTLGGMTTDSNSHNNFSSIAIINAINSHQPNPTVDVDTDETMTKRALFQLHETSQFKVNSSSPAPEHHQSRNPLHMEAGANAYHHSLYGSSLCTVSNSTLSVGSTSIPFTNSTNTRGTSSSTESAIMQRLPSDVNTDNSSFTLAGPPVLHSNATPGFVTDSPTTTSALVGANASALRQYICPSPSVSGKSPSTNGTNMSSDAAANLIGQWIQGGVSPCLHASASSANAADRLLEDGYNVSIGSSFTKTVSTAQLISMICQAESLTPTTGVQNGLSASVLTATPPTEEKPTSPSGRTSCDPSPLKVSLRATSSDIKQLYGFYLPPTDQDLVCERVISEGKSESVSAVKEVEGSCSLTPPPCGQEEDYHTLHSVPIESAKPLSNNDFTLCADDVDDGDDTGELFSLLPSAAAHTSCNHSFGPPTDSYFAGNNTPNTTSRGGHTDEKVELLSPPILEEDSSDDFMSPNSSLANIYSNESYRSPQLLAPPKLTLGLETTIVPFNSVAARCDHEAQKASVAAHRASAAARFNEKMASEATLSDTQSLIGLQLFVNEAHRQHTAFEIRRLAAKQQSKMASHSSLNTLMLGSQGDLRIPSQNGSLSRVPSFVGTQENMQKIFSDCDKFKHSLTCMGLFESSTPNPRQHSQATEKDDSFMKTGEHSEAKPGLLDDPLGSKVDSQANSPLIVAKRVASTATSYTTPRPLPLPLCPSSLKKATLLSASPSKSLATALQPTFNSWHELRRLMVVDLAVGGYGSANIFNGSASALLLSPSPTSSLGGKSPASTPLSKGCQFLLSDSFTLGGTACDYATPKKDPTNSSSFDQAEAEAGSEDGFFSPPSAGIPSSQLSTASRHSAPKSATYTFLLRRVNGMSIFRHGLTSKHLTYDDHEYERIARADLLRNSLALLGEQKAEGKSECFLDDVSLEKLQTLRKAGKLRNALTGGGLGAQNVPAFPSPSSSLSVPVTTLNDAKVPKNFAEHFSLSPPRKNDDNKSYAGMDDTPNHNGARKPPGKGLSPTYSEAGLDAPPHLKPNTATLLAWDIVDGDEGGHPEPDDKARTMPPAATRGAPQPVGTRSPTKSSAFLINDPITISFADQQASSAKAITGNPMLSLAMGQPMVAAANPTGTLRSEDGYFCPPQGGDGNLMFELQGDGSMFEASLPAASMSSRQQFGLSEGSVNCEGHPMLYGDYPLPSTTNTATLQAQWAKLGVPSGDIDDCFGGSKGQ